MHPADTRGEGNKLQGPTPIGTQLEQGVRKSIAVAAAVLLTTT